MKAWISQTCWRRESAAVAKRAKGPAFPTRDRAVVSAAAVAAVAAVELNNVRTTGAAAESVTCDSAVAPPPTVSVAPVARGGTGVPACQACNEAVAGAAVVSSAGSDLSKVGAGWGTDKVERDSTVAPSPPSCVAEDVAGTPAVPTRNTAIAAADSVALGRFSQVG
jgi:hypothetical protein